MNFDNLDEIIKIALEKVSCPICGRKFSDKEIRIRGRFNHQYLVQVGCHSGHNPALVLHIISSEMRSNKLQPINSDYVLDLHEQLKNFNGDFRSIFKQIDTK